MHPTSPASRRALTARIVSLFSAKKSYFYAAIVVFAIFTAIAAPQAFSPEASAQVRRADSKASKNDRTSKLMPSLVEATLIQMIDTSLWVPASPDPSGIAYNPLLDRLIVVDSEVDEETGAGYNGVNLWETTRQGVVTATGTTLSWGGVSNLEPTGAGYDPATDTLFISSDDGGNRLYAVQRGADGLFGTADDLVRIILTGFLFSAEDTEDPDFDPVSGHLFFVDGVLQSVFRVDPVNGVFGDGNDVVSSWPYGNGMVDAEALTIDQARDLVIVGGSGGGQRFILEFTKDGNLVRRIDTTNIGLSRISGMTMAPASNGSGQWTYWIVDRAVDNGSDPNENDGKIWEIAAPPDGNMPPRILSAEIDQDGPKTNDTLTTTVDAHDDDGDSVAFTYEWYKNSVLIPGETGSTLDLSVAGNGDKGDEITVRVQASDGTDNSTFRMSDPVTVMNTAPVLNLPDRENTNGDTVNVSVAATDADGDAITYSATGLPTGLSIDANTGQVTGTIPPFTHEDSPFNVQVTAADGDTTPAGPITLVQTATPNGESTVARTVSWAAQPTEGNLLVALGRVGSGRYPTMDASWHFVILTNQTPRAVAYYKIAGPAESMDVTLNATGTATGLSLALFEYSGTHPDFRKVLDSWVSTGQNPDSNGVSAGTLSTLSDDVMMLAAIHTGGNRVIDDTWTNGFSRVASTAVGSSNHAYAQRLVSSMGIYETSNFWGSTATTSATSLIGFRQAPDPDAAEIQDSFVWTILEAGTTSAGVSVRGRVSTGTGRAVTNAVVVAQDLQGNTWRGRTNGFGYYILTDLPAGGDYLITVNSKQYSFSPRLVSVQDELWGIDFISGP